MWDNEKFLGWLSKKASMMNIMEQLRSEKKKKEKSREKLKLLRSLSEIMKKELVIKA